MAIAAFVHVGRPATSNKNVGKHGEKAQEAYRKLYPIQEGDPSNEHRYGIVHYFVRDYRPTNHADAGNIAKRVWDALEGVAYEDDEVVRLQLSSVICYGATRSDAISMQEIDLTNIPSAAAEAILQSIYREDDHFLYVELGVFRSKMLFFGLEAMKV